MKAEEQAFLSLVALGAFMVDSQGAVWRHRRMIGGSRSGSPSYQAALARPERAERSQSGGYPKVMFTHRSHRMAVYAHRIVWMVVNGEDIPDGLEINHKNGIRSDNHPSNLELVTHSENMIHGIRVLGRKPKAQYGEMNACAKLTAKQVAEIKYLCAKRTLAQSQIAKRFGVTQSAISAIHLGKSWGHVELTG